MLHLVTRCFVEQPPSSTLNFFRRAIEVMQTWICFGRTFSGWCQIIKSLSCLNRNEPTPKHFYFILVQIKENELQVWPQPISRLNPIRAVTVKTAKMWYWVFSALLRVIHVYWGNGETPMKKAAVWPLKNSSWRNLKVHLVAVQEP